ncbi:MAG: ABC-2 family transporter protein, partial [Spirochaetaceae bacterium]|nr:ABC-2 family transporter protein [Spirochaetaceae bacterium]
MDRRSNATMALHGPGPLRMAFRYAAASLRSRMQYRSSFLMESLGHVMEAITELLGIVVLFSRFGSIRGWTVSEVALFYGVVHVVFAVAEGIGRGFESLESHVKLPHRPGRTGVGMGETR